MVRFHQHGCQPQSSFYICRFYDAFLVYDVQCMVHKCHKYVGYANNWHNLEQELLAKKKLRGREFVLCINREIIRNLLNVEKV